MARGDALGAIQFDKVEIPPAVLNGATNAEHYRAQIENIVRMNAACLEQKGCPLPGFNDQLNAIERQAKLAGLDTKRLADRRTPEQRLADLIDALLSGDQTILEATEAELGLLENAMDLADQRVKDEYRIRKERAEREGVPLIRRRMESRDQAKKLWRNLLNRVRRLQERARNEHPPGSADCDSIPLRAAHLLRFMVYVTRSNTPERIHGPTKGVMDPAAHLCRAAWFMYQAEHGIHFSVEGVQVGVARRDGVVIVMPPGHGKTDLVRSDAALAVCRDPYTQGLMVHAIASKASDNLRYIQALFSDSKAEGRRCRALFPGLILADTGNTQTEMRLRVGIAMKAPTFAAWGMSAKASGANASRIYFDDPCDQKEADSPTERDRTSSRISGTWLPRLRGKRTFWVMVATLWHEDDAVARRIKLAEEGKLNIGVLVMGVGGPDGSRWSTQPFCSIWPEEYPPNRLRQRYAEMQSPNLYARQYMAELVADEARLIRRVRFYDPDCDTHREFLRRARFHMSADPSASAREKADKAGLVHAGVGEVRLEKSDDGFEVIESRVCLRVLNSWEIRASQLDLAQRIGELSQATHVDEVHVETVSGFMGVAEMLRNEFGISPICHQPGSKSKEMRLRRVAPALDDFYNGAVVEFPGVRRRDETGREFWEPHPDVRELVDQVLNFGASKNDHMVDALTQLTHHLMPLLGVGREGTVSRQVREAVSERRVSPVKQAMWDAIKKQESASSGRINETAAFSAMFN